MTWFFATFCTRFCSASSWRDVTCVLLYELLPLTKLQSAFYTWRDVNLLAPHRLRHQNMWFGKTLRDVIAKKTELTESTMRFFPHVRHINIDWIRYGSLYVVDSFPRSGNLLALMTWRSMFSDALDCATVRSTFIYMYFNTALAFVTTANVRVDSDWMWVGNGYCCFSNSLQASRENV